jgi:hypothetical protein
MFILRTTSMPTLTKLTELERIVAVDNAGVNQPVGPGRGRACIVGECLQGPFTPTIVTAPSDITSYYVGDSNRFTLLSQGGVDPTLSEQDGSAITFDGNVWAELKGKSFSGLVIQRVDCDMVTGNSSVTKMFVKFDVVVAAADQAAGVTNKDIVIPSGTRFADQAIGTATKIIATSQQVTIPTGTAVVANAVTCGVNFTQSAASGELTYVATGATTGVTAFFVKGTKASTGGSDLIDTAIDNASITATLPGVASYIGGTVSTIVLAGTGADAYAPAGGGAAPSPDTLANRILACYANAIDKTLPGVPATNDIIAIWSARNYHATTTNGFKTLRAKLWANAIASSKTGRGRVACVTAAPALATTSLAATTAKGVYTGLIAADVITGDDADRFWLSGPFVQVFSAELNANITISVCGTRAAMKVNLFNDGKSEYQTSVGGPENSSIQNVDAQEACFAANPLQESDYIAMKAAGVSWFTQDRTAGWWFYSGVTAANPLTAANRVADNRRSFADEIQDTIFGLAAPYSKKPGTTQRADAFTTDMRVYVEALVNPPVGDARAKDQRILDGAAAGNNDTLNGHGVYLFSAYVQMFGDMNALVINTMIGPNVIIAQVAPAS